MQRSARWESPPDITMRPDSSISGRRLSSTTLTGVAVSPNGDFQINDMLSKPPPVPCASPLLLIQSATNSHWFALGIVGSGDD